jgi:RecA/RadA recombinase
MLDPRPEETGARLRVDAFVCNGNLFGGPGHTIYMEVQRVQPWEPAEEVAGEAVAVRADRLEPGSLAYDPAADWIHQTFEAVQAAARMPIIRAAQAFVEHELQWLDKQARDNARAYTVIQQGTLCGGCENVRDPSQPCGFCGANGTERQPAANVHLERRGRFEKGDKIMLIPKQGGEREGAIVHIEQGGRQLCVRWRENGALHDGELRPLPITAVHDVQLKVIAGFAARDPSLRRLARLLVHPEDMPHPVPQPLDYLDTRMADNPSQRQAVEMGVALPVGGVLCVQGPPGTGKTTSIVEIVRQLLQRDSEMRILVTSHSNTAVDNAQERLQDIGGIRMARIAEPDKVDARFRESIVGDDEAKFQEANVVFGTVNRIAITVRGAEAFDLLILDEANKVRLSEALPLLRLAPRWLMVGDHKQLPPVLDESAAAFNDEGDTAREAVRDSSFFELLWEAIPDACKIMLGEQYRMAEPIGSYVSRASYGGRLATSPQIAHLRSPLPWPFNRNMVWLQITGRERKSGSGSLSNRAEIAAVGAVVRQMQQLGLDGLRTAVIAMYQDQVAGLRSELRTVRIPGLAVDTVDAFEGEEADIVIISLVRSNEEERIGFLKKAQRLNVAVSRAKKLLVVVGDPATVTGSEGRSLYTPLLEHIRAEGRVASIGAVHAMRKAAQQGRPERPHRRPMLPRRRGLPPGALARSSAANASPADGAAPGGAASAALPRPRRRWRPRRRRPRPDGGAPLPTPPS